MAHPIEDKHYVKHVQEAMLFPVSLTEEQVKANHLKQKHVIDESLSNMYDYLALQPRPHELFLDIVVRARELFNSPLSEFMTQHYLHTFEKHTNQLEASLRDNPSSPETIEQFKALHSLLKSNTLITEAEAKPLHPRQIS